ncbi:MAG: sulfatase-like hydrolase/transferase [Planctomycetota bacterium]
MFAFAPSRRCVAIALVVLAAVLMTSSIEAQAQRPNVLILLADDLRSDAVGAFGGPDGVTPHIDSLAEAGVRFTANYCMGSRHGAVCAPSRAMFMTGRALTRVPDDMAEHVTMPQWFRAHGWNTFATGKWHNGRGSFTRSFDKGESIFFGGMADHRAVPVVDFSSGNFTPTVTGHAHSTQLFAEAAIRQIELAASPGGGPFFCYVAFTAPHDPRDPPTRIERRAASDLPPLPPNFRAQHGWNIGEDTLLVRDEQLAGWPRRPEVVREQLADYQALVHDLDHWIGRILGTLDRLRLRENTIVVFAADHGLALGSHGLLGKQSLYDHSMRCPLSITGPGLSPETTDSLTYLFDVFPTLTSLAGLPLPDGLDGRNGTTALRAGSTASRDDLFLMYRDNQRALRDSRYKLLLFPKTGKLQLFDLSIDPHEITDLANDPAHAPRIESMLARMREWQTSVADRAPLQPARRLPQLIDLTGHPRAPDRFQPEWIRAKYFAGDD